MSSRYYNNAYSSSPYASPYRSGRSKASYFSTNSSSYSPKTSSRRTNSKKLKHWQAKQKHKDEDDKKTKLGEFNHESIEAELNKYKKGVFYHDDKIKDGKSKTNKTSKSNKQYS